MTNDRFPQSLVVLNVPVSLEEVLIDWLLARADDVGFTVVPSFGHGVDHQHLSAAEQVSGRQRRLEFQIQMSSELAEAFLASAREAFGRADMHYSVLPMSAGGHINS